MLGKKEKTLCDSRVSQWSLAGEVEVQSAQAAVAVKVTLVLENLRRDDEGRVNR